MRKVRKEEVYRYLGYKKRLQKEDLNNVDSLIDKCIDDLEKVNNPSYIYQRFPLKIEGDMIIIEDLKFHSKSLSKNLEGCHEVFMFAATCGIEIDRFIRKAELMQMSKATIYQAIGAELIENVCDELNEKLKEDVKKEGYYLKPRFSPGYGDTSLTLQKDFERLLCMSSIGINLTDSLLMVPSKSVTAFIGISQKEEKHQISNCTMCDKVDCHARKV